MTHNKRQTCCCPAVHEIHIRTDTECCSKGKKKCIKEKKIFTSMNGGQVAHVLLEYTLQKRSSGQSQEQHNKNNNKYRCYSSCSTTIGLSRINFVIGCIKAIKYISNHDWKMLTPHL